VRAPESAAVPPPESTIAAILGAADIAGFSAALVDPKARPRAEIRTPVIND